MTFTPPLFMYCYVEVTTLKFVNVLSINPPRPVIKT